MELKAGKVVAAIDVGSNFIRLLVAQIYSDGSVKVLEDLNRSCHIGKDTFTHGKIEVDSIHKTSLILSGYGQVMKDYGVEKYRAVCTSGIREASNREYVVEQLKQRTGINLEVINNAQERFYMYKALWDQFSGNLNHLREEGVLILNIGSGGIEISIFENGNMNFSEYIKVGSLRLREVLADLESKTLDFNQVIDEFVYSSILPVYGYIKSRNLRHFIGLGGEIQSIFKIIGEQAAEIKVDQIQSIYEQIKYSTTQQLTEKYNLSLNRAKILLPSIITFRLFAQLTKADRMLTPLASLRHGLIEDMIDSFYMPERKLSSLDDIINSVWYIAGKFQVDIKHTKYVENMASFIFDRTKDLHQLDSKYLLYLRIAAILHDVGKFINLNKHSRESFRIVDAQSIIGLSNEETDIVAGIVRYHSENTPNYEHREYRELDIELKVALSKLSAILKIAEALDATHKQKVKEIDIDFNEKEVIIFLHYLDNPLLEKWTLNNRRDFYEEVMGYKLTIKG